MTKAYRTIRPLIFRLTPEQAHQSTIALLRLGGGLGLGRWLLRAWFRPRKPGQAVQAFGLTFPNPLGMAAGYDKDGLGWRGLACLGFGHIEVGTVTPRPQPGNPQPRIFRLVEQEAVINRMGFPNRGAEFLAARLRGPRPEGLVLGVNIGKNKATPLEEAAGDYLRLFDTFAPLCDYLAVNISSPNTPDLRKLQSRQALEHLLAPLAARRAGFAQSHGRRVPLLVKLAPDLTDAELDEALDVILAHGMDGVIIHNTTLRRDLVAASPKASETGGLSGRPINAMNTGMVRKVVARTAGALPVVASGGVMNAADVKAKLDAGAVLVQLYTGLIYEGPGLVRDILNVGLRSNV
jgi:dihydroorotate dehydrogenase